MKAVAVVAARHDFDLAQVLLNQVSNRARMAEDVQDVRWKEFEELGEE
jgi:hypothetical protein